MFPRFDKLLDSEISHNAALLTELGFADGAHAARSLGRLAALFARRRTDAGAQTDLMPSVAVGAAEVRRNAADRFIWYRVLERVLCEAPLRDTVLNVAAQFVENCPPGFDPFVLFAQTPRSLEILARIACGSPFLTQTLLSDPESLAMLSEGGRAAEIRSREQFVMQVEELLSVHHTRPRKLTELRRYQRREILRIGMCDAFGLMDLRYVTLQLSLLADAMIQVCLNLSAAESNLVADDFVVLSLGKHGGEELNYSSDIDLVLIATQATSSVQRLARLMIDGLAENLPPGFLYRVDLRLRPWGDAGPLVGTPESYTEYLRNDAALWEKQALLKARVVAGNREVGKRFLALIRPLLFLESAQTVRTSIRQMKERIESRLRQRGRLTSEVKLGAGSIRDVEFLVQFLQLANARTEPRILSVNTLDSLVRLAEFGLLSAAWYRQLRTGYIFLRTVEHALQLLHNQQVHELPTDQRQLEWLANRMDYPDSATLLQRFEEHRLAVRAIFEECVGTDAPKSAPPQQTSADATVPAARSNEFDTPTSTDSFPIDELLQRLEAGESVAVSFVAGSEQTGLSQSDDDQLVIVGTEFRGWLSVISGLLSILRIDIRRGEALAGGGTNQYGLTCPENRFLAVLYVRPQTPISASVAAGGRNRSEEDSPESHGAGGSLRSTPATRSDNAGQGLRLASATGSENAGLATSLQAELQNYQRRILAGGLAALQSELISRFGEVLYATPVSAAPPAQLELEVRDDPATGTTALSITGTDTPGFLFELAHALSLSGFQIRRAMIESIGDQVRDLLFVTEVGGGPVVDENRRQELQTAVALIKQFMHWLPSAGNPHQALQRFRDLLSRLQSVSLWPQNVQSMQRPDVLHAIALALGISPFLWDEFLQTRHGELFPLLANAGELAGRICRDELSLQLSTETRSATPTAAAWKALNSFKDRHLFRIDLRHILGHCRPFGTFADEITELAELVVSEAATIAWNHLVAEHGRPTCTTAPGVCQFAIAGLGKFGGGEMGYASDLEMMLIYEHSGSTEGKSATSNAAGTGRISNARFFDLLVAEISTGIVAREDGIFHVDLRMRPFGNAGSAAVSLEDFRSYYGPEGPAWPYERQALAKFRCVSGTPVFAAAVSSACHECIYTPGLFDFAAMHAMRERQIRQLVRGGSINAKLSDGGIVDCEYAVQALQLTFGHQLPTLQHANSLRVLREAARLSLIRPEQSAAVEEAYIFLRELIDCLRMVRGNARDLTVPRTGTSDYDQLSRRMRSLRDSPIPLEDLELQMATVREFARTVEHHCRTMRPK